MPVQRIGEGYHSTKTGVTYASATAIRNALLAPSENDGNHNHSMFISTGSFDFELRRCFPILPPPSLPLWHSRTFFWTRMLFLRLSTPGYGHCTMEAMLALQTVARICPTGSHSSLNIFKLFAVCRSLKKQKYNIHTHLPCTAPHPAQHPAGRLCCALAAGWHSISACAWFPQGFLCASFCHQKKKHPFL